MEKCKCRVTAMVYLLVILLVFSVLVITVVLRSCLAPAVAAVAAATAAACCYYCCCVVVTLLAGTDIFTENAKTPRWSQQSKKPQWVTIEPQYSHRNLSSQEAKSDISEPELVVSMLRVFATAWSLNLLFPSYLQGFWSLYLSFACHLQQFLILCGKIRFVADARQTLAPPQNEKGACVLLLTLFSPSFCRSMLDFAFPWHVFWFVQHQRLITFPSLFVCPMRAMHWRLNVWCLTDISGILALKYLAGLFATPGAKNYALVLLVDAGSCLSWHSCRFFFPLLLFAKQLWHAD